MAPVNVDPVTLAVVWGAFLSICEEIGRIVKTTSFSEAVREADDFSCGILDHRAQLIAQGNFSPGHLGSMPFAARNVLKYYPLETLKPGDSILTNDPHLCSGHLPDFYVVTPVFYKDEIVAFTAVVGHQVDVGGAAPGGQKVQGITEIYQEGLRLLPVKAWSEGKMVDEIFRIIEANVRVPDKVIGDLKAQRNGCYFGTKRICDLFDYYGVETVRACMDEILSRTEQKMRAAIREAPDGTFTREDYFDDYGPNTEPIKVRIAVTIAGDEITVDFTGSSPEVPAGFNSPINYTKSYVFAGIKAIFDPVGPQNEGGIKPIKVIVPEGSFFNPRPTAGCGGRAAINYRIFENVVAAFAEPLPERVVAAASHWGNPTFGGRDPRTGKPFVSYEVIIGGTGARPNKDGCEGLCFSFNARNIPVEVQESAGPVLIECYEFIQDSGGPGKFRGGLGVRRDLRMLTHITFTNSTDRSRFAPFGLFGGKPGAKSKTIVRMPSGEEFELHSKESRSLPKDSVVSVRLAGSGGYGDPFTRDVRSVLRDVEKGFVSIQKAEEEYGVIIDPESMTVDLEATEAYRNRHKTPV